MPGRISSWRAMDDEHKNLEDASSLQDVIMVPLTVGRDILLFQRKDAVLG